MADPIGANFTIANGTSGQPTGDWNAELAAGFEGGSVSGYFAADWYDHSSAKRRRFRPLRSAGSPTTCILDG